MLIVGLSWTLDHMDLFSMAYGEYMCWIGTINGSSIFFAGPICFVLLTNGLMYAKVIYKRVLATKLYDKLLLNTNNTDEQKSSLKTKKWSSEIEKC